MIRAAYRPADVNTLIYTNEAWSYDAFISVKPGHFQELVRVWAGAIVAHPGAYLQRRYDALATILGVSEVVYPFHRGISPNTMGLEFKPSPASVVSDRIWDEAQ